MKVRDLIEALKTCDADAEVILQKDAEGNDYSPLFEVDPDAIYVPDTEWSGNVYSSEWDEDEMCMDAAERRELLGKPRCVVLCPIN